MSYGRSFKLRLLLVSAAVLVVDQWTKSLVETHLATGPQRVIIPGFLDLIYVRNSGIAFGLFAAGSNTLGILILTLLGGVALALVLVYFWKTPAENRWVLVSLSLILGGAVGNLLDRLLSGSVTDFIEVYVGRYHWPTFNAADSAISIGIVMMVIDAVWLERRRLSA
jgi:signal peptidase II